MTPAKHLTLTLPSIAVVCLAVVFSAFFAPVVISVPADYLAKRKALIQSEQRIQTGGTSQTLNPVSYTHLTLPTTCGVYISVVAVSLKKIF